MTSPGRSNQAALTILMVVHQFLPRHLAGSEVYTYNLAQALRKQGHRVVLFFTEMRADRPQYELTRGEFNGIPYFEAVHNRYFSSFTHTYRDERMEENFRAVVDDVAPDVVHLQHLYLHSIRYIEIARQRGLPVVYTLHEYMLMCLNRGLLLKPDLTVCEGPEPEACGRCAALLYPNLVSPSTLSRVESSVRTVVPQALLQIAGRLRSSLSTASRWWIGQRNQGNDSVVEAIGARRRQTESQMSMVNLFVAPSQFLRQRFLDERLVTPERILYSDYGSVIGAPKAKSARSSIFRVGYIGTIAEFKGVHLILEAFREIRDPGIECRIYGDLDTFPDFRDRLLGRGTPANVRFMGRLENEKVSETLADLDLLIVPSIWFENSPLTIHEASLAGVPVLTSDRGGMAELVEPGRTGLHFRLGDADDLRRQLLRLLHEPGLLESLGRSFPHVKTMDEDASSMVAQYRLLLSSNRSRP